MPETYTTSWQSVSNGDITTHDPQSLVPTDKQIRILSAEVQWEGITTSSTSPNYQTNTNRPSADISNYSSGFSQSLSTSFPSVPNGYNYFINTISANIHTNGSVNGVNYLYEIDGDRVIDGGSGTNGPIFSERTNYVGSDVTIIVSADSVDSASYLEIDAPVRTTGSKTTTTYDDTEDPRVTRDVLGESGGITLNDNERSTWYTLDSLDPNEEEFYHDINGSDEAYFRFRFEWEKTFPDALKQLRVYDVDDEAYKFVALADPSDPQLVSNAMRVSVNGTTYAVDVTDVDDPSAITSHRGSIPSDGTLAFREYDSISAQ